MYHVAEHDADRHREQQDQAPRDRSAPARGVRCGAGDRPGFGLSTLARPDAPRPAEGASPRRSGAAAVGCARCPITQAARTRSASRRPRQHLAHRSARLQQGGEQQVLGREPAAGLARLLRRHLDEALGVGGIRQLRGAAAWAPAPPARLEPLAHPVGGRGPRRLEHRRGPGHPAPAGPARCARRRWRHAPGALLRPGRLRARAGRWRSACADSREAPVVPGSERLGFVDQHDGNAVLDRIDQPAGVADEGLGRRRYSSSPLHLGQTRICSSSGARVMSISDSGKPKRVRAVALFRQWGSALTQQSRYTGAPISSSSRRRAGRRWP